MYKGAFVPGFMLVGLYLAYVAIIATFKPAAAPALPADARTIRENDGSSGMRSLVVLFVVSLAVGLSVAHWIDPIRGFLGGDASRQAATDETIIISLCAGVLFAFAVAVIDRLPGLRLLSRMAERVTFVLIPPLALIFLVLGTIFLGVATPTEGGAMGAVGALVMAISRKRLSWSLTRQALNTTAKLSSFVMFILIGSTTFNLVFQGLDGGLWIEYLLTGLPGGERGFLIVSSLMIFVLAFCLDFY